MCASASPSTFTQPWVTASHRRKSCATLLLPGTSDARPARASTTGADAAAGPRRPFAPLPLDHGERPPMSDISDLIDFDSLLTPEELALRDLVRSFVDSEIKPNISGWYEKG